MTILRYFTAVAILLASSSLFAAPASFGPGVTGGGDSCRQNIARSFGILNTLFKTDKIDLSAYGVSKDHALAILSRVTFQYSTNLEKDGTPVEMLNVFGDNIIIIDRKICDTPREPLGVYTPLLLHEVVRLMGADDGSDYHISNAFQVTLQQAVTDELGLTRNFAILSGTTKGDFAIAWGLDNQDLDFRLLRNLSMTEQSQFLDTNWQHIVNYLVYVPTMTVVKILRTSSSPRDPIWDINGMVSNHNDIDLSLAYTYPTLIGMIYGDGKWTGSIESLFSINIVAGMPVHKELCNTNCNQLVYEAALRSLTSEQKTALAKWPTLNMSYKEKDPRSTSGATWIIEIESFQMKTDNYVTLQADITFNIKADGSLGIVTGAFTLIRDTKEVDVETN